MQINRKKIIDENGQLKKTSIWEIEIDFNNLEDLENLHNKLKAQINSLHAIKNGTNKEKQGKRFDSCLNIYNTDISDLYSNVPLDPRPIYYVYAHCSNNKIVTQKDGVTSWLATLGCEHMPFYIGKGTGKRAYDIDRNETHRKIKQKMKLFDNEIKVQIIKDNLTELEALSLESKLIDILGVLGKGGRLVNLDEGVGYQARQKRYLDDLINIHKFHAELNKYKKNT